MRIRKSDYLLLGLLFAPIIVFARLYFEIGLIWVILLSLPSLLLFLLVVVGLLEDTMEHTFLGRVLPEVANHILDRVWAFNAIVTAAGLSWLIGTVISLNMLLGYSLFFAAGSVVVMGPVFAVFLTIPLVVLLPEQSEFVDAPDELSGSFLSRNIELLGVSAALSFGVTMLSIVIGHLASPEAPAPQSLQMLLVNVGCDGLTMLITFSLLGLAVRERKPWRVPVVVVLDLVIAAVLACTSLYFGLLGSDLALTVQQTLGVLVGLAPAGTGYELGPYFWVMHTTFLPTAAYLTVIMLCWIGKLIVLPISKVLGKARVVEKPHVLSAVACGFVAVVFGVIATGLGHWEDELKEKDEVANRRVNVSRAYASESQTRACVVHLFLGRNL